MSEKTAKVFLAKRIYVMFGNQYFLENLRNEGFQTFSSVLDESYDQIRDPVQRYTAAWRQVEWLATQDADSIYQRLESVVEHNHPHIFEHKKNTGYCIGRWNRNSFNYWRLCLCKSLYTQYYIFTGRSVCIYSK
jgi:hypothetical protein